MASILLLTSDTTHVAYTRTKIALESQGHTVTGSQDSSAAVMDAAWAGGPFDALVAVRVTRSVAVQDWIRQKWTAGTPIMVGGIDSSTSLNDDPGSLPAVLGLLPSAFVDDDRNAGSGLLRNIQAHPITEGFSGDVAVLTVQEWHTIGYPDGVNGTQLGSRENASYGYLSAVESGEIAARPLVTASSSYSTTPPAATVDGDPSTYWVTDTRTVVGWLRFTPAVPATLTGYTLTVRSTNAARRPRTWTFEGSNDDGATWDVLDARTDMALAAGDNTFSFSNATEYAEYRLNVTANNGDSQYLELAEFKADWGAPALPRAVFCGWLFVAQGDYTPAGATILGQAVEWLAPGARGAATLEHAWQTAAKGEAPRAGTATLAHEWTTTATGDDTEPNYGTATLAHEWTTTATGDDMEPSYGTAALEHAWQTTATAEALRTGAAALHHAWTTIAEGDNGQTELDGWTRDQSQQVVLDVTGPDTDPAGPLLIDRAPATPPATITERPILLHAHQATAADFTVTPGGAVHANGTWEVQRGIVGTPHTWVDGIDITYFRGAPVLLDDIVASEPFGWESATLTLPQVSVWEELGVGDLAWLRADAQVECYLVDEDGAKVRDEHGHLIELFSGHLVNDGAQATESDTATIWECAGDMDAAAYYLHRPPITLDPTDIGALVPKVLNGVVSRRYGTIDPVTTGITTRSRGSGDDYVSEYASELLAEAWTDTGEQWTIARTGIPRQYEMRLKDTSTVKWTLVPGTPGVAIRLDADHASRSDAVMGRGVGPDGYAWSGRYWPSLLSYNPPDYPNTNAGNTINPGETDADTDSGDGVSVWQARAADLGYQVTVDGHLSAADSQVVRDIQARMGLQVDGIIGPQTWTGTWEVGVDSGALESIRLPLAWRPEVEPNLYGAQGNVIGDNPAYDPRVIRRERPIDYGPQTPKRDGIASARREVQRTQDPGWYGTITATSDPREGSRFLIAEGDNVRLPGWRGADLKLYVAKVHRSRATGTVTLTVDSKARDAMTLASLRRRDRDAQIDPARRPGNVNRQSRQAHDLRVTFEGDSPAGRIHRRALFAGLWSVFPIPISEAGEIVKLEVETEAPASEFTLGFFAAPVQPSHLKRLVGSNPSWDSSAWRTRLRQLEDLGFIEAWGAGDSMAGHWPDQEGPVTGELKDKGGWSYHSDAGGWVWVAAWAPVSTFIKGRVFPAPID